MSAQGDHSGEEQAGCCHCGLVCGAEPQKQVKKLRFVAGMLGPKYRGNDSYRKRGGPGKELIDLRYTQPSLT